MHPHAGSRPPAKIIHIIAPTLLFLLLSLSLCIHLSAMHGTHQPVYSAPVVRHPLTRPLENWASIEHDSLPRRVKGQIRHHLGQSSLMDKIGSAFLETSISLQQHCCAQIKCHSWKEKRLSADLANFFSCPGQLNRWPCQSLIKWVSEWHFLILYYTKYNDYNDFNDYNDYN